MAASIRSRLPSRLVLAGGCLFACLVGGPARADKISHPTAVFAGLDKITGRIISFDVAINETVQFGSLQITPRVCFTRPPTEAPRTDTFAEVDEIDDHKKTKMIFSGWMFADSPGLHGIEHPVYDIWLTDCKGGTKIIREAPPVSADLSNPADASPDAAAADPNAKPAAAAQPPKKRKPKPAPTPAAAAVESAPLDLNTTAGGGGASSARNPVTRRFFPTDAPPTPPADIPN